LLPGRKGSPEASRIYPPWVIERSWDSPQEPNDKTANLWVEIGQQEQHEREVFEPQR
jgi:hypothetical protein